MTPLRRTSAHLAAAALAVAALLASAPMAHADDIDARGSFQFNTGPGILPTWNSQDLRLSGLSPATTLTNVGLGTVSVTLPVVARNGTASATAGGFRILNVDKQVSMICANPAIDTRALVIDCVVPGKGNMQIFAITDIASRSTSTTSTSQTQRFEGLSFRVASPAMADYLNDTLQTNVFSPSVTLGSGTLTVTSAR
jgi:hypothetical protein